MKKSLIIICIALVAIVSIGVVVFLMSDDKKNTPEDMLSTVTPTPAPTVKLNIPPITDDKKKDADVPTETPKKDDQTDKTDELEENTGKVPTEPIVEEPEVVEEVKEKLPVEKPKEDVVVDEIKEKEDTSVVDEEPKEEPKEPVIDKSETSNTIPEAKEEDKPIYGQDDNNDPAENPFGKGETEIDETDIDDVIEDGQPRPGEGTKF